LQLGERLGLGGSLGNQLGHGLALLVGELHCRSAAALADCRVYCGVDMGDPAIDVGDDAGRDRGP
jgi:hypothetical protein